MPADLNTGLAYQYCHGDSKSVELLKRLHANPEFSQHLHHQQGDDEGTSYLGEHCAFVSVATALLEEIPGYRWELNVDPVVVIFSTAFFIVNTTLLDAVQARAPPATFRARNDLT